MIDAILRQMAIQVPLPCAPPRECSDADLISNLVGWAYFVIVIVVVIVIAYAGIQYMTSEGEPEKAKAAQRTIAFAVVGLIIATAAWAIIGFVRGALGEPPESGGGDTSMMIRSEGGDVG
jgi:heme/copper-type cytochrome/quinol oxidase subunit 2